MLQFGMKMMKLDKKQSELLKEMEKRRKAKLSNEPSKLESFKVGKLP